MLIGREAKTWEWDETNGWIEFPASGGIGQLSTMWFDRQRGHMVRYDFDSTGAEWVRIWTGNPPTADVQTWKPVPYVPGAISPVLLLPCYDSVRNRVYTYQTFGSALAWLTDVHPATYEPHGDGCASPSTPTLALSEPWTRAWLGGTLEVTVKGAIAALATGFTDQSFGAVPLPLDLTPFGMPQCQLRVAPEFVQLGITAGHGVPFPLPIPNVPSLIGTEFWQQAFVLAPGANAAGLLASNSMHGRIGKSH
jgi:hypothetical protein